MTDAVDASPLRAGAVPVQSAARSDAPPLPKPALSQHPLIGAAAVLLGSIISTINGRITSFGIADIEGAVHTGFDEGAWINTAFTVGQMLVALISPWLGIAVGTRRLLFAACVVFAVSNFLLPFSPNLAFVLAFQFVSGVSSGTFIPLAIAFILLGLPPRMILYGIAAYAVSLELSLNVSASLEGWFEENLSWHWIFWNTAILTLPMLVCVYFGVPRQAKNAFLLKQADRAGMLYASLGLGLIYAALDQGNRLDWLNAGLINALLCGGGILLVAFVVRESTHEHPWINLRYATSGNVPLLAVFITLFRFITLSTAYLIPQYLATVQGYRALEIGDALIWIALPQILIGPIIATILRLMDARLPMALGFALVGCACFLSAHLTATWSNSDLLVEQLIQAVGQTMALTAMLWFAIDHLNPNDIFTLTALIQVGRLFGAELGSSFIQTFVRVREQVYSNLIGLHVFSGSAEVNQRLQEYTGAVASRSVGPDAAHGRAVALLATAIRKQAYVLAYNDGFMFLGLTVIAALVFMLFLRHTPEQSILKTKLSSGASEKET